MAQGKFIVFEGIDGSGKGTQAKKSALYLFDLSKENDIYLTREPTRDFKEIRARMAQETDVKKAPEWYANMFIKDRVNHTTFYIEPNLAKGTHVVNDRYKLSTVAYQSTQGMDINKLIEMQKDLLIPNLTIIIDCPADIAFERRKAEGATDMFDKDLKFQEELRQTYLKLPSILNGEKIVVIDGTPNPNIVFEQVKKELNLLLK